MTSAEDATRAMSVGNHHADPLNQRQSFGEMVCASRRVALIPLTPSDYEFAYRTYVHPAAGGRLNRWGGAVPSPERVMASLWEQTLAQFVVVGRTSGRRLGLTALSTPDFANRFAYFSVVAAPEVLGTGLAMEGALLTIDVAFRKWDFRKLYFETVAPNLEQFRRATHYMNLEAHYRSHAFVDGAYRDVLVFAIYRDQWSANVVPRLAKYIEYPPN